ncbi:hypothetical protein GF373_17650 [bacterium]|nr:hypothetical protein [bacterium]
MTRWYTLFRNTVTGSVGHSLPDLAHELDSVTLQLHHVGDFRRIPFEELEKVPFENRYTSCRDDEASTERDVVNKLREVLLDGIDPHKFHFVYHSSGYDSRMTSALMKELDVEDVLFVCTKWEGKEFKDIMRFEGWNEDQYVIYNEHVAPENYYGETLLDFSNVWQSANGLSSLPVNLFWYPLRGLQASGRVPPDNDVQVIASQWANTCFDTLPGSNGAEAYNKKWKRFYDHPVLSHRVYKGVHKFWPFLEEDLLRTIEGLPADLLTGKRFNRSRPLRMYLCELIKNDLGLWMNAAADGDKGHRVSSEIMKQVRCTYNESFLGRRLSPTPDNRIRFSSWWRAWTCASFVEHLLAVGIDVNVM